MLRDNSADTARTALAIAALDGPDLDGGSQQTYTRAEAVKMAVPDTSCLVFFILSCPCVSVSVVATTSSTHSDSAAAWEKSLEVFAGSVGWSHC